MLYLIIALVECSEEFVLGYIQILDGERDPRNLLLAFSSVLVIIRNLHFGMYVTSVSKLLKSRDLYADSLVDDLFDVISCYFPVDFSPVSALFSAVHAVIMLSLCCHYAVWHLLLAS